MTSAPAAHAPVAAHAPDAGRLIKFPELIALTSLSRAEVYRRMKNDPTFPKPISMGVRAVAFLEAEVVAWIRARVAMRDAKQVVAA